MWACVCVSSSSCYIFGSQASGVPSGPHHGRPENWAEKAKSPLVHPSHRQKADANGHPFGKDDRVMPGRAVHVAHEQGNRARPGCISSNASMHLAAIECRGALCVNPSTLCK